MYLNTFTIVFNRKARIFAQRKRLYIPGSTSQHPHTRSLRIVVYVSSILRGFFANIKCNFVVLVIHNYISFPFIGLYFPYGKIPHIIANRKDVFNILFFHIYFIYVNSMPLWKWREWYGIFTSSLLQFNNSHSPSEDELPPDVEPPLEEEPVPDEEPPPLGMLLLPRIYSRATRSRWSLGFLPDNLTLVVGNFRIHIINEGGVILFAINECKGVYHLYQSTVSIITWSASCFQSSTVTPIFSLVRCKVSILTRSLASFRFITNAVKPNFATCAEYLSSRSVMKLTKRPVSLSELASGVNLVVLDVLCENLCSLCHVSDRHSKECSTAFL